MSVFTIGDETEAQRHGPRSHRKKGSNDLNTGIWLWYPLLYYCFSNDGNDKSDNMTVTPIQGWKCDFGVLNDLTRNHLSCLQKGHSSIYCLTYQTQMHLSGMQDTLPCPHPTPIPITIISQEFLKTQSMEHQHVSRWLTGVLGEKISQTEFGKSSVPQTCFFFFGWGRLFYFL